MTVSWPPVWPTYLLCAYQSHYRTPTGGVVKLTMWRKTHVQHTFVIWACVLACAWISLQGKAAETPAESFEDHQHGRSRRVHEVPLAAGVAVCQQRNGLQLQRQEEVHHMEEAVDLPGQGWEGLGTPRNRLSSYSCPLVLLQSLWPSGSRIKFSAIYSFRLGYICKFSPLLVLSSLLCNKP